MSRFVNFSIRDVQIPLDDVLKGSSLKIPEDVSKLPDNKLITLLWERTRLSELIADELTDEQLLELREVLKIKDVLTVKTTLSNIEIGTVEDDQRSRLRSALQLVDQNEVSKGTLSDDRQKICYFNGNLYGVKRLLWKDITSSNQRTNYEASNEAAPINGSGGSANFSNASNQWLTIFFASRKVFKVICRHSNNNWAVRQLEINNSTKNLTSSSGIYTYVWTPANGWQDVYRIQFVDNGGSTSLNDLQILYADSTFPTLTNGESLAIGDFFKVEGDKQLLRFDGVDNASQSWKAVPVSSSDKLDTLLSPISTNGVENKAIYWGIENLKTLLNEKIDNQAIVDEIAQFIDRQLLFNALVINKLSCLFEEQESLKSEVDRLKNGG